MALSNDDPRQQICELVLTNDREKLLARAGEIHGHFCPFLGVGVNASVTALNKLNVISSTGMEEVMAVVECNNCFVDGIQAISGCTLGNNALIYQDLGKNAVTFYKRGDSKGCRFTVHKENVLSLEDEQEDRDAKELSDKAVTRRETLSDSEKKRFHELWTKLAYRAVRLSENDIFAVSEVEIPNIPYARMVSSVTCSKCGEEVMETRAAFVNEEPACRICAGQEYWTVAGRGIHPVCANRPS